MDRIDRALIDLLEKDCRVSNVLLAERAGISASSCWRRIKALEEQGVILRYVAVTDPAAMGLQFEAMVHVQLRRHDSAALRQFIEAVRQRAEVIECFATTGQADYHLRVLCESIEAYNEFLENFLFLQSAVQSAHTNVVLRHIKSPGRML